MFAGYTIVRVLGAGGMGSVYLATHPRLPREDALKILPPDLTTDPEFRARFEREAELAAGLSHPHIVRIHDRGEFDGQFWISMDYVAGTDAARLLGEQYPGGMPLDVVVSIITAVGSALDYAHNRGLLHRDVKPANILLTDPDVQARRVYLADFGIARRMDDAAGLTKTNMTLGTVNYAAPEQLRGESIDGRADQYALACTAFHLLTGSPPYGDSNPAVVIAQHVSAPPPSIGASRPELAGLDAVFATAMAKEKSARFGSCRQFTDQLSQHLGVDVSVRHATDVPDTHPQVVLPAPVASPPTSKRSGGPVCWWVRSSWSPCLSPVASSPWSSSPRTPIRPTRPPPPGAARQPRPRQPIPVPSPGPTGSSSARAPASMVPRLRVRCRRPKLTVSARRAAAPVVWRPRHGSPAKPLCENDGVRSSRRTLAGRSHRLG